MLYVFQVDTGQMLNFEMDVAISTVLTLKSKIHSIQGIPIDKQVLLVSGGEILDSSSRVCNYAAGTDTNPIFLFNRLNIEQGGGGGGSGGGGGEYSLMQQQQQLIGGGGGVTSSSSSSSGGGGVVDGAGERNNVNLTDLETLHKQIQDASTSLPPTYTSVVTRTQLAQHIYDMGKELTRKCELLIHHQHLQHQGWAAVVANLDDIVGVFNSRMLAFSGAYEGFFKEYSKEAIDSFVDGLESTLKTLDSIKLPTEYYVNNNSSDNNNKDQANNSSSPSATNTTAPASPQSVVQWLSEHFPSASATSPSLASTHYSPQHTAHQTNSSSSPLHTHLTSISTTTRNTHSHLSSPNFLPTLQSESTSVTEKASSPNMREIKGLEERLFGLDQLLQEAKKIVVDQHELTQAFHQNVSRASDLRDSSIFPDLCASHQHQLLVMYKNHSQLEDIRRRCGRAKEELTTNLNTRLKWIAFVQKSLSEMSGKISVFHESLRRLRIHVNILQQVSSCQRVHREYLAELRARGRVGRKLSALASRIALFNRIAERESRRRAGFREAYAGHFLSQAFSVLVEDREVRVVGAPSLVQYHYDADDDDHEKDGEEELDEDEEDELLKNCYNNCPNCAAGSTNATNATLVTTLQQQLDSLTTSNTTLESRIHSLESQLTSEKATTTKLKSQMADCRMKSRLEGERAGRLAGQVEDLKRLIDEFRVKEEEVIRVHGEEVEGYERRVRGVEEKCEERVVELGRMLEFEYGLKVKAIEEAHKLEYDAMVQRFKHVNKSVGGGGAKMSSPVIGTSAGGGGGGVGGLAVAASSSPRQMGGAIDGLGVVVVGSPRAHHQHHVISGSGGGGGGGGANSNILFGREGDDDDYCCSDDDDDDESGGGGDRRRIRRRIDFSGGGGGGNNDMDVDHHNQQQQQHDDDCGGGGGGESLERAVDAAAAFLDGGGGGASGGGGGEYYYDHGEQEQEQQRVNSSNVVVPERVITTATRLHKLSRISISTCRVGSSEPNLFYWNEKFNAFTVYLNNRNVHFLNSNSGGGVVGVDEGEGELQQQQQMSSTTPAGGDNNKTGGGSNNNTKTTKTTVAASSSSPKTVIQSLSKSQMFIANITDKEFCVARRAQNRYNVPQGFHFYRVKCNNVEEVAI